MSLTKTDLQNIRTIVREEIRSEVRAEVAAVVKAEVSSQLRPFRIQLQNIEGRLEAVENDVKEIYFILAKKIKHAT